MTLKENFQSLLSAGWLAVLLLTTPFLGYSSQYAVVVGVADYPGTENDLNYTDDDAVAVAGPLLEDARWQEENVRLLSDEGATKGAFRQTLLDLVAEASAGDLLLVYFSGHGTTGPDLPPYDELDGRDEYLCSYGSSPEEFIRDDELSDWLANLPVQRIIVILDTCYSGGQIRSSVGGQVKGLGSTPLPLAGDGFSQDLQRLRLHPLDLPDLSGWLAVLTSSAEDELSWEFGPPYGHGLFTYFLLQGMDGWADTEGNANGETSAEECFSYLEPRVLEISDLYGLNQHPQLLDAYPGEAVWLGSSIFCEMREHWLEPGWHMISVPGNICGSTDPQDVLGDDVYPLTLYRYDPEFGGYRMYSSPGDLPINPGHGYWLKAAAGVWIDVELAPVGESFSIPLAAGWNQIGQPYDTPVLYTNLSVRCQGKELPWFDASEEGWVVPQLFGYDPITRAYFVVPLPEGRLEPWQGYWLKALCEDCELVIRRLECESSRFVQLSRRGGLDRQVIDLPPPIPGLAEPAASVQVVPLPNPLCIPGATTFQVRGICPCSVQGLRVEVYDLAGNLVWAGQTGWPALTWRGETQTGLPVAHGVYLFRAYIKQAGEWALANVGKVAVMGR